MLVVVVVAVSRATATSLPAMVSSFPAMVSSFPVMVPSLLPIVSARFTAVLASWPVNRTKTEMFRKFMKKNLACTVKTATFAAAKSIM